MSDVVDLTSLLDLFGDDVISDYLTRSKTNSGYLLQSFSCQAS